MCVLVVTPREPLKSQAPHDGSSLAVLGGVKTTLPLLFVVFACSEPDRAPLEGDFDAGPNEEEHLDCGYYGWCEDGVSYEAGPISGGDTCPSRPSTDEAEIVATCVEGCNPLEEPRQSGIPVGGLGLCWEDRSPCAFGVACVEDGETCDTAPLWCAQVPTAGSCTCRAGDWGCVYDCAEAAPFCSPEELLGAMVGSWEGTVSPPSFAEPYPVQIEFFPDGRYSAECPSEDCVAFYDGTDDDSPVKHIDIAHPDPTAGAARIIIAFDVGTVESGELGAIQVTGGSLSFEFWPAWAECGDPFRFELTRSFVATR